jgi:hypothetical protein
MKFSAFLKLVSPISKKRNLPFRRGIFRKYPLAQKPLARIQDTGGPDRLNSPLPPCKLLGRGSKESITRKSPINRPSLAPFPHAGEKEQGRAPFPSPQTGEEEERATDN